MTEVCPEERKCSTDLGYLSGASLPLRVLCRNENPPTLLCQIEAFLRNVF